MAEKLLGFVRESPGQPGYGSYQFVFGNYGDKNHIVKSFSKLKYGAKAKAAAEAYQKDLQPHLNKIFYKGETKINKLYKRNKSFRDFVNSPEGKRRSYADFDFLKARGAKASTIKDNLYKSFLTWKNRKTKAGYNTTSTELAKKLGVVGEQATTTLHRGRGDATEVFLKKLIPSILGWKDGKSMRLYKDPTPATIKKVKEFYKKPVITSDTVKRVKEIDKLFRDMVVNGKTITNAKGVKKITHLPDLFEVMEKTSATTPSKAAAAMGIYSRALKGEEFRVPLDIRKNNSSGENLITELGSNARTNAYRNAFYRVALDNVNKQFDKQGTLGKFKTDFARELRKVMGLKDKQKVPYNINEVISISAGETRGIRPFSVFVDATAAKINSDALAGYQAKFSQRLGEVQDLLAEGKKAEARAAADKLLVTQKTVAKNLLAEGFTKSQIKQLNLAEIKVGKTIDPKIYSPEKLARWKEAGLDIPQFVKEKGFYIDVKKGKPFWESNVSNTVIEAAKNNVGNICNIFKGRIVFSAEGGRVGFQGGCGREMTRAMQTDPQGTLQHITKTEGIIPKFKNVAQGFLGQLGKLAGKGGRLGALVAGAGAVGLGTYAMTGDAEADETGTTDQSTMKYNSTTGTFDNTLTGDPEDQEGVLNWIADNPVKGGLLAFPAMIGLGYGATKAGMPAAGRYLTSWKAAIPALMVPEKMYQWKSGMEAGEMATDPLNALWALGIRGPKSMKAAEAYYADMLKQGKRGLDMTTLKSLKNVQGWKNLPGAMRTALMSPAATGTDLAFQKRLKPAVKKLTESIIGSPAAKQAAKKGLGALAKRAAIGLGAAALLPATVAAGLVSAPLTLGLGALSFGYAQYKDYRDGKAIVDSMRARGQISEEDAENYMSLIKQGSLPFGLGNRLFGDDEMTLRGQTFNPEQQRELLAGMEDQIDLFQEGRRDVRALDRADDFDFFSEGGRVGMRTGGMDRRGFLKWLMGLAATVGAGTAGLFKTGAKKGIEQVAKQAPKQFVGVEGMPAWFPRAIEKIKTHGKLLQMADKHYVNGDIYEMIIPTKVPKFDMVAGQQKQSGFQTVNKKVILEDNPVSGEIEISWSVDDFDGEMKRQINFKPGESGFQKFGADPEHPGAWEYHRVKVEEPEFTYGNPDQSTPDRDAFDYKDIFEEGDEVVKALEDLTGNKKMVAQDGSIIDTVDEKNVDESFQKKIFKDIEGEEAMIADPEGQMTPDGWSGDKGNPIIGGEIPTHLKKKARGGTVETGDIARRQSLVPPLAGPDPQGIMGLYSTPKQVRLG